MEKTVNEFSSAELEQLLAERKEKERREAEAAKQRYEKERDGRITLHVMKALEMHTELKNFKTDCHAMMDEQLKQLQQYGHIRSNSKGGFSITSSDGTMRITRRRDTEPYWDERSQKGIELIKEFLFDKVKKRDEEMFKIMMGFLVKNKQGDLEYSQVMSLMEYRTSFNDERWIKGLELLQEGYSNIQRGFSYEIKRKDENGKWETISLNFPAI